MKKKFKFLLSLGGINILLQSREKKVISLCRESFGTFAAKGNTAKIRIDIIFDEQFKGADPYAYGNPHRTSVVRRGSFFSVRGGVYRATFDLKKLKGQIRQDISESPVYLFLRFVISVYFPLINGFLIHSSSIVRDGRCFLFSGPPKSGKSTVARLSGDYHVLSDDFSIVRKVGGVFCGFGSPFWGHVQAKGGNIKNKAASVPIKGIYFLEQDGKVYAAPLSKAEAMFSLIRNICVVAKDKAIHDKIIRVSRDFSDTVPCNSLHFKLDNSFWRCVKDD